MVFATKSLIVTRVSPKMIAFVITIEVLCTIILIIPLTSTGDLPGGSFENDTTTCEEFSRFARFNPYSVLSDEWMVFYYWAPPKSGTFVKFYIPTNKDTQWNRDNFEKFLNNKERIISHYKKVMLEIPKTNWWKLIKTEGHVQKPINWTARSLLMIERNNSTYFLVERNDRGHYYFYEPYKGMKTGDILEAIDIRIKQTSDNKYIGIMECLMSVPFEQLTVGNMPTNCTPSIVSGARDVVTTMQRLDRASALAFCSYYNKNISEEHVFLFARIKDVPKKKNVQEEAAKLGYRGRGGRSYLYQGHSWMPIPEADDEQFEDAMLNRDKYLPKIRQ